MPANRLAIAGRTTFEKQLKVAACPHCADGGNVEIAKASPEDSGIFKPLPTGWDNSMYVFQCQCGWSQMLTELQASEYRSK